MAVNPAQILTKIISSDGQNLSEESLKELQHLRDYFERNEQELKSVPSSSRSAESAFLTDFQKYQRGELK